jgi:methylenetetrahydrofolate dehydrogenase (NADP+)/methenyltetrahydrofolate cyclohydrolase
MKLLNGADLAEFIKVRQAQQVRGLRQASDVMPKLAIVKCSDNPVITTYVNLKKRYGADILVDVDIHDLPQAEMPGLIRSLNDDDTVHGIIIQLPLPDPEGTDLILDMVAPGKDVDGLGSRTVFDPATPLAITWLLAGYNIELKGKKVVLVGRGKLVGAPLEKLLLASGVDVSVIDRHTADIPGVVGTADVIITATGSPAILNASMIPHGCVVVDAGVAVESGRKVGDLDPDVYARDDLIITPVKGGVGPLTVCALFDNVIRAARNSTETA